MTEPPLPPEDHGAPDPERRLSADQEPPMTPHLAAEHLTLDELTDLVVEELGDELGVEEPGVTESPGGTAHLAGCPDCQAALGRLRSDLELVSSQLGTLGEVPAAPMPVTVAARLDRVLAQEAESRLSGQPGGAGPEVGDGAAGGERLAPVTPLKAPATASYVRQTGAVKIMLAAAAAAAVVGFGGYVLSASAGLNEPSAISPTQVHPDALASQAKSLAESRNLDPHLFSYAWRCARTVTTGRITGITPVYVDGEQNYLVYTRSGGITYATLVSGCDSDDPTAGRPVKLTE